MPKRKLLDTAILETALGGLQLQRQRVEAQVAQVQRLLVPRRGPTAVPATAAPKRRISAAARKGMAEAQRKRWAALRKAREESAPKKHRLSAEGRRNIIEAARKQWAEFRVRPAAKEAKAAAKKA